MVKLNKIDLIYMKILLQWNHLLKKINENVFILKNSILEINDKSKEMKNNKVTYDPVIEKYNTIHFNSGKILKYVDA